MMHRLRTVLQLSLALTFAGCTCGPQSSGAPLERGAPEATPAEAAPATPEAAGDGPTFEEAAGGLAWHAEEPLVSQRPSSSMRAAQYTCLLYTSPSPRDLSTSRMPSSA